MDQNYIERILAEFEKKLQLMPDAKSGIPERISFIIQYKDSTVVNGFDVQFYC